MSVKSNLWHQFCGINFVASILWHQFCGINSVVSVSLLRLMIIFYVNVFLHPHKVSCFTCVMWASIKKTAVKVWTQFTEVNSIPAWYLCWFMPQIKRGRCGWGIPTITPPFSHSLWYLCWFIYEIKNGRCGRGDPSGGLVVQCWTVLLKKEGLNI